MASGLKSLIKLNKHVLDEKRQSLAKLYEVLDILLQEQRRIEENFNKEKEDLTKGDDIGFTFQAYVEAVRHSLELNAKKQAEMQVLIEAAKDSMMDTFSELKKYEMTQSARDKRLQDKIDKKENAELDEIAIEGYRRKEKSNKESYNESNRTIRDGEKENT